MLLEVLIDQFAELTEQCRASAVGRPCGQGRLIEPCDLYQQGDQQGMAGRHVVAFLALRFVLNQLNQWPDGFRAIRNPGQGNDHRTLHHCQQIAGENTCHGLQRPLRCRDDRTIGLRAIAKRMHGALRQQDQARRMERHATVLQRYLALAVAHVDDLQQRIVLMGPDFALMHVAAVTDPLQMQQILPRRQRGLAVQRVIGNASAHGRPRTRNNESALIVLLLVQFVTCGCR